MAYRGRQARELAKYRYGGAKKPAKLKTADQIFQGQKREHVITLTMDVLRDWRFSRYQNEAIVRHGLRTGLVLDGFAWQRSDDEAEAIVRTSFGRLGYVRPKPLEGQREYVIPRENCQRCGTELDDNDIASHRRFCSDLCRESSRLHSNAFYQIQASIASHAATYVAQKAAAPPRTCIICSNSFQTVTDAQTCSKACAAQSRDNRVPERECQQCSKLFRPHTNTRAGRYCSKGCADEAKKVLFRRPCEVCGNEFQPYAPDNVTCSRKCSFDYRTAIMPSIRCEHCTEFFSPKTKRARFCSRKCKDDAKNQARSRFRCDVA